MTDRERAHRAVGVILKAAAPHIGLTPVIVRPFVSRYVNAATDAEVEAVVRELREALA